MSLKTTLIQSIFTAVALLAACSGEKTASEYLDSAKSHLESGNVRTALIETRNAVSQAPDNSAARLLLGTLELKQGNPPAAEAALLKAKELGTPRVEIAANLAEAYFFQGKLEELQQIDASSLNDSDKARVLAYHSEAALIQGEIAQANQLARDALNTDPLSSVALTINARLQLFENNIPEARTYLATTLDAAPDYSLAWELLGDIELSLIHISEPTRPY